MTIYEEYLIRFAARLSLKHCGSDEEYRRMFSAMVCGLDPTEVAKAYRKMEGVV